MENTIENGIICLFDILGYKNFIVNNSLSECADNIRTIISKLPDNVKNKVLDICESEDKKLLPLQKKIDELLKEKFHYIIVSDTILLAFDFSKLNSADIDFFRFISLAYIQEFQNISFRQGFPVRGCVDIGSFYYYDHTFAGNTIINSFCESESIDFSGILITDNALNFLEKENTNYTNRFIKKYVHRYLVPMKNNIEAYKNIIEWQIDYNKSTDLDLKQKIFESFHAHKKDVSLSVMNKINNTEKIYRYFLMSKNK